MSRRRFLSVPFVVFASTFVLLGWIASHSIAYTLVGFIPHDPQEAHMHGYLHVLKLAGGCGLVLALCLALRMFSRYGSFGDWLHEGGTAGLPKQVTIATALPAGVFIMIEYLERLAAGTGTLPSARLLLVGILVQLFVGLLCLTLVRFTFRVAEQLICSVSRHRFVWALRWSAESPVEDIPFVRSLAQLADSAAGRAPPFSVISR
jgi:hypothetical protein